MITIWLYILIYHKGAFDVKILILETALNYAYQEV